MMLYLKAPNLYFFGRVDDDRFVENELINSQHKYFLLEIIITSMFLDWGSQKGLIERDLIYVPGFRTRTILKPLRSSKYLLS